MVTLPEVARQIDGDLRLIAGEIDFLPELASDWAEEASENQSASRHEWAELMVRFDSLNVAYRAGRMSAVQAARYRALVARLQAALPLLVRLDLPRPTAYSLDIHH